MRSLRAPQTNILRIHSVTALSSYVAAEIGLLIIDLVPTITWGGALHMLQSTLSITYISVPLCSILGIADIRSITQLDSLIVDICAVHALHRRESGKYK